MKRQILMVREAGGDFASVATFGECSSVDFIQARPALHDLQDDSGRQRAVGAIDFFPIGVFCLPSGRKWIRPLPANIEPRFFSE